MSGKDVDVYIVTADHNTKENCVLRNHNDYIKHFKKFGWSGLPQTYLGYQKAAPLLGFKKILKQNTLIILKQFAFSMKTGPKYWDSHYEAYVVSALQPDEKDWDYGLIFTEYDDNDQVKLLYRTKSQSEKGVSNQISSGKVIDGPVMPVSLIDAPKANVSSGYYRSGDRWKDKVTGLYEFHGAIDIPVGGESGVPARAMYRVEWMKPRDSGSGGLTAVMKILAGPYKDMILEYMHLYSVLTINEGKEINAGDQIGIVGQSGGQPIIHLHLEIRPASAINSAAFEDPKTRKKPIEANRENLNKFFRDRAKGSGAEEEWYPINDNGVNLRDKA